jgi:hypothetical protein
MPLTSARLRSSVRVRPARYRRIETPQAMRFCKIANSVSPSIVTGLTKPD